MEGIRNVVETVVARVEAARKGRAEVDEVAKRVERVTV